MYLGKKGEERLSRYPAKIFSSFHCKRYREIILAERKKKARIGARRCDIVTARRIERMRSQIGPVGWLIYEIIGCRYINVPAKMASLQIDRKKDVAPPADGSVQWQHLVR